MVTYIGLLISCWSILILTNYDDLCQMKRKEVVSLLFRKGKIIILLFIFLTILSLGRAETYQSPPHYVTI